MNKYNKFITFLNRLQINESLMEAIVSGHQAIFESSIPQYLYHATYEPALNSIAKHDLGSKDARKKWAWSNYEKTVDHVYLHADPDSALSYAESSDNVPDSWIDQIVLLRINTSDLDLTKLKEDPNLDDPTDSYVYYGKIPQPKLTIMEGVFAAHPYKSPRWGTLTPEEANVRDVAYSIKNPNSDKIDIAAQSMASYVSSSNVLIPIPSSKGDTSANLKLANAIAKLTGATVIDALGIKAPRMSNRQLGIEGKTRLKAKKLGFTLRQSVNASNVLFIDNVSASGATIQAAQNLINGGHGLVYAKVDETQIESINSWDPNVSPVTPYTNPVGEPMGSYQNIFKQLPSPVGAVGTGGSSAGGNGSYKYGPALPGSTRNIKDETMDEWKDAPHFPKFVKNPDPATKAMIKKSKAHMPLATTTSGDQIAYYSNMDHMGMYDMDMTKQGSAVGNPGP